MVRGIIAAILLTFSSISWGAEICERLLKKDFRETSNIRLAYNDSGVVIEPQTNLIQKVRFGSAAAKTSLEVGDRILALNGKASQKSSRLLPAFIQSSETSAMRIERWLIQKASGEIESIDLKRLPYLGHPIVEPDIILKDIEVIQQSSKTNFTLDVHLKWKNEDLIHNLFRLTDLPQSNLQCIFRKSAELDNILQKIWYPTFETEQTGASIDNINYKSLLITNEPLRPFNFQLVQQINYEVSNNSDFRKFPFDHISTSAEFLFQDVDLSISPRYDPTLIINQGNDILYEWEIHKHELDCCNTQAYGQGVTQQIDYTFDLNRKYFYYVLKIILPVIFLVWLSFSSFWIRAKELESKLAVSMGSLLTLVAYNFVFGEDLPKLSYITILDAWILLSYLFAGLSSMITIWSFFDYHRDKQTGRLIPSTASFDGLFRAPTTFWWLCCGGGLCMTGPWPVLRFLSKSFYLSPIFSFPNQ